MSNLNQANHVKLGPCPVCGGYIKPCKCQGGRDTGKHIPSFLRPTAKETARREIISFLELEKCRLEVLLMANKFKEMPDVYQDLYCVYAKHLEAFEGCEIGT